MKSYKLRNRQFELVDLLVDDDFPEDDVKYCYVMSNGCVYYQRVGAGYALSVHIMGPPSSGTWDHIDRNKLNNQRSNFRLACSSIQGANHGKQTNNTSGYKGVTMLHGKWRARLTANGVTYTRSKLETAEDAAVAYDKMIEIYRPLAPTNKSLGLLAASAAQTTNKV